MSSADCDAGADAVAKSPTCAPTARIGQPGLGLLVSGHGLTDRDYPS